MKKPTLCLLLAFLPAITQASNRLLIENSTIAAPDTGKFYIVMQNDVKVNGSNFIIKFDPSLIAPLNIRPVERAAVFSGASAYRFSDDKISFVIFDQDAKQIQAGSGRIFEIAYQVLKDTVSTSFSTQVAFYQGIAADSNLAEIPFEYQNGVITGVKEKQSELPKTFALFQNYPNPFNPTTTIRYQLPVTSNLTLKIYDILGREVTTLIDGVQEAGYKTVIWDATNGLGLSVASGVYFYRITATAFGNANNSFTQVKRMLFLK